LYFIENINKRLSENRIPIIYCDNQGFKNHAGECWNDTIQTLMCFSDGIREHVQKKLWNLSAEAIYSYAELNGRLSCLPNYFYKKNFQDRKSTFIFKIYIENF
jgi:hypothetical protein